jgi:hypothetical protein
VGRAGTSRIATIAATVARARQGLATIVVRAATTAPPSVLPTALRPAPMTAARARPRPTETRSGTNRRLRARRPLRPGPARLPRRHPDAPIAALPTVVAATAARGRAVPVVPIVARVQAATAVPARARAHGLR